VRALPIAALIAALVTVSYDQRVEIMFDPARDGPIRLPARERKTGMDLINDVNAKTASVSESTIIGRGGPFTTEQFLRDLEAAGAGLPRVQKSGSEKRTYTSAAPPPSPAVGMFWCDTTINMLRLYDGKTWSDPSGARCN
jgi:hypothetical protein